MVLNLCKVIDKVTKSKEDVTMATKGESLSTIAKVSQVTSYRSLYPKTQPALFGSKTFSHLAPDSVKLMVAKEYEPVARAEYTTSSMEDRLKARRSILSSSSSCTRLRLSRASQIKQVSKKPIWIVSTKKRVAGQQTDKELALAFVERRRTPNMRGCDAVIMKERLER